MFPLQSKGHECETRNHIHDQIEVGDKTPLGSSESTGFIISVGSELHVGHKRLASVLQCL